MSSNEDVLDLVVQSLICIALYAELESDLDSDWDSEMTDDEEDDLEEEEDQGEEEFNLGHNQEELAGSSLLEPIINLEIVNAKENESMPAVKSEMKNEELKTVKSKATTKKKTAKPELVKEPVAKAKSSASKRGEVVHQNGDGDATHEVPEASNGDGPKIPSTKTKRATKKTTVPKEELLVEASTSKRLPKEKATATIKRTRKALAEKTPVELAQEEPANVALPKNGKTIHAKETKKAAKTKEVKEEQQNTVEESKPKRGRAKKVTEPSSAADSGAEEVLPKKRSRKQIVVDDVVEKPVNKLKPRANVTGRGTKNTAKANVMEIITADTVVAQSNIEEALNILPAEVAVVAEQVKPITKLTKAKSSAKVKSTNKKVAAVNPAENITADSVGEKLEEPENEKEPEPEPEEMEKESEPEPEEKEKKKPRKRAAKTTNDAKIEKIAKVPKNSITTIYDKESFALQPTADGEPRQFNLKISSWNVAGLRSWVKKDGFKYLDYEESDILCLQETKCADSELPDEAARLPGYHPYWLCKPGGYAGVAIYSKIMPIHVDYGIGNDEFDNNGRIITAEYEKFYLVNVYVPNSGRNLVNLKERMRWEQLFFAHVERLDKMKAVIICGDMNVSHEEIDLANPKANVRNAGFTAEEREKMTQLLSAGFVDTFRQLYPDRTGAYTFWTYMGNARSRNVGWRLDYFLVSNRFMPRVVDNAIRTQCKGSDHCPITLFLNV